MNEHLPWSLDQLITLLRVAETGSFSAAARSLGRAQSAVSTAIAHLEADLACTLFDRSTRLPRLTDAGHTLVHEARQVLAQCQRFEARARTLSRGEEASLTIAIEEALVEMPPVMMVLERLASTYPALALTVLNGAQDEVARWIEDGSAHLGIQFAHAQPASALERASLGQLTQVVVVGREHPLAQVSAPSAGDLAEHRQLMIAQRQTHSADTPQASRYWRLNSFYAMAELAVRGLGWARVPRHIAHYPPFRPNLVQLDVTDAGALPDIAIELISRRDSARGPVSQWLRNALAQALKHPVEH
ncbi:LysR family transcriptional regulator [Larsenimonas suaedae]|uniref:LysR family transcriptional regulator n=1 Tax=Larsenimonas suaedae TaxID=1851019 RepID=A0ABU1GTA5_9GAMM|nr:LysR family transcriptional regulator [Larsenimonas suaedae]MCM2972472.1 LysR family transcriptional regulator [Larsenimonas suaedae]MDR5894732.1 LysR family transcriptional regulator [Larsenimonas suaedae]